MTTAVETLRGPRLWIQALYTVPWIDPARVDPISRWLILGRVSVVVMSAISAVIGGLLAAHDGVVDLPLLLLVCLGLVLAHTGSNLVNDFWDYRHGIDTPDSPRANYGPHPLAAHAYFRQFVAVTLAVLAGAAAIGVYLTAVSGPGVLIFALSGAALLMFYSGGPFPLKYVGLGEIAVFVIWGPLMIGGTYYVLTERLPAWVLLASVPYALGVTSVLLGKHLDKLDFDREKGVRTLPVVLGESLARRLTVVVCALMYVAAAALAVAERMPGLLTVAAALPLMAIVVRFYRWPKPKERPRGYRGWPLWFVGVAFIHNRRFGLLLVAGLAIQVLAEEIL